MENTSSSYIPGACNINRDEIKKRQVGGAVGVAIYVVLFIFLVFVQHIYFFRLFLFLPALMAAVGFVQARSHFCVAFGSSGKENATDGNAKPQAVTDVDAVAKDKAYAHKLLIKSAGIAAIFLVLALACPPYK